MSIRALIVDDEEPARGELRYLLAAHPEVEVVGEAATSAEALALAGSVRYDVVFLDIELPGMTGLEVARLVLDRSERPRVVFVTAHDRYAVDAFAVEAFDYLVKPVEPERLARVVERLLQARTGEAPAVEKIAVVSAAGAKTLLDYDAVYWIEADGDYSRVHTYDRAYHLVAARAGGSAARCPLLADPPEPSRQSRQGRGRPPGRSRPAPARARRPAADRARRCPPPDARVARAPARLEKAEQLDERGRALDHDVRGLAQFRRAFHGGDGDSYRDVEPIEPAEGVEVGRVVARIQRPP